MKRLITVNEAAEMLSMSSGALRVRMSRRRFPFVRLSEKSVRIDVRDIERMLKANRVEAI